MHKKDPVTRFDHLKHISSGGFGNVFQGHFLGDDDTVAIKVINAEKNPESNEESLEEVHFLEKYSEQTLPSAVLEKTPENGQYNRLWCAMEYCGGGSVRDLIKSTESNSLPEHWIKYICKEML
ncbi:hypothetical protein XENTR_v10013397 [Xenopus tropicalis]|nr:hypothetical protein XENTR_v10013397 [Xenopus tropicalis]